MDDEVGELAKQEIQTATEVTDVILPFQVHLLLLLADELERDILLILRALLFEVSVEAATGIITSHERIELQIHEVEVGEPQMTVFPQQEKAVPASSLSDTELNSILGFRLLDF